MKKPVVIVLLLVVIVAALFGARALIGKSSKTIAIENPKQTQPTPTHTPTSTPTPTPKPTQAPDIVKSTPEPAVNAHICKINPDCNSDEYCAKAFCEAIEGTCQKKPTNCPSEYHTPVCSCEGGTYSNDCSARRSGYNVRRPGAC